MVHIERSNAYFPANTAYLAEAVTAESAIAESRNYYQFIASAYRHWRKCPPIALSLPHLVEPATVLSKFQMWIEMLIERSAIDGRRSQSQ